MDRYLDIPLSSYRSCHEFTDGCGHTTEKMWLLADMQGKTVKAEDSALAVYLAEKVTRSTKINPSNSGFHIFVDMSWLYYGCV